MTHCEINSDLSTLVNHNYKQLDANNISTISKNGIDYLTSINQNFDWIYIDPSRRHDSKGKVFFLKDCLPNVPEHMEFLFKHTNNILIKTSPLLDLTIGIHELKFVDSIHIVALNNEVKELLWVLKQTCTETTDIITTNLKKETTERFQFAMQSEKEVDINYQLPLDYLYEPNTAILKSGAFKSIAKAFNVSKLHIHTHLYSSHALISFPGRRFKIEKVLPFNKKHLKNEGLTKANITTRNFPESVEQLKKRFRIQDGGKTYFSSRQTT